MRELHVQLTLGASLPGSPLEVRSKLISAIEDEIGEVGDTGSGGGVMDIWLYAEKPRAAARQIRRIAKRLGIAEWTEVTVEEARIRVEILCDDAYSVERATATGEALVREVDTDPERWAEVIGQEERSGIIEIELEVRDPAAVLPRLEKLAKRLGIADRVRIDEK